MKEGHLLHTAAELVRELNKAVDEHLPQTLAGIVKLHAGLAVGSAFIPIPGADIAAVAANTWAMYVRINKELCMPFGENITKSIAAGVMTNIASNAAGFLVAATAAKFLPGIGTLGGAAVMGTTVYALTIAAGIVYMKALTKLLRAKSAQDITEADLQAAADGVLQDKTSIREIVKEAKKSYKQQNNSSDGAGDAREAASSTEFTSRAETVVPPYVVGVTEPHPVAAEKIFVATGGKTYGPYLLEHVRRMRAAGQLAADAHYWREGMVGWRTIASLPEQ